MKKLVLVLFAFALSLTGGVAWGQTLPDNWTGDSGIDTYQNSTTVHDGSTYSCKVAVNTGTQANCDMRNDEVSVTAGRTYTFKFWGYTSTHVKIRAVLQWTGTTITYGGYLNANSGGWLEHTETGTVPAGATGVKVGVRFYDVTGFSAPETQYIDDFTFESPTGTSVTLANGDMESWPSSSAPDNPTNFTASTASTSEIDLAWTQNGNSDNVMVAWSSDGTFGTPTDGTTYSAGNAISGGGTVLYNGSATSYNHTGLTPGTHYYYKAWSVDGSTNYSAGATDDATTYKAEPSNHVTSFSASASSTVVTLSWTENDGTVAPDGYLIKASTGTISAPADGTDPSDDVDLTDGSGNVKVAHGTTSYSFTNCNPLTTYNFKIYPYTNSGSAIKFKTNGTVPSSNTTTGAAVAEPTVGDLKISEVNSTENYGATYVEIYNTTATELSLQKVNLDYYNNGGGTPSTTINLTGSIAAHGYVVVARDSATFQSVYGFSPDFSDGNMILNGGDDGLILQHDDNGILDHFNNAPAPTTSWVDNHLFYRFKFSSDGSSLSADWDDAGKNRNGTPKAANTLTWKTTGGTNWGTGSNWNNGDVPSKGVDVVIPSGGTQPFVNGTVANPAACMNLTINNGAILTIPVGDYLTVNGNLTNNSTAAGLVIQSSSSGNGSLIVSGTVTGTATVQRYIAAYTSGSDDGWHEIGSPVNNMTISGSDFAPGTNDDLYAWGETTNTWLNYKVSGNNITNFTKGVGYLVAYQATATKTFTGTLNNSNVSFSNLSYSTSQGNGWNLLGNPYPSALTWGDANWILTNVGGVAKVWDESAGNYADISSGGVIPSTNGFFVQVSSATNSLIIPAADRVHDATNNFKSASANPEETLKFKVTNDANGYNDVSTIGFKVNATVGFDNAFDSHKLFSLVKTAPSLWSVTKEQQFSTNYLPEMTTVYNVPLDFKPGVSTLYHLSVSGVNTFDNPHFVLEDTQTGTMIDLTQQTTYDFSAAKGDDVSRFVLHINGITAVPNVNETDGIEVFAFKNTVYLHGQKALNGKVSVFNTLGQKVYEGLLNGTAKQQIRLNQRQGIYFVRLEENNRVVTRKVAIK